MSTKSAMQSLIEAFDTLTANGKELSEQLDVALGRHNLNRGILFRKAQMADKRIAANMALLKKEIAKVGGDQFEGTDARRSKALDAIVKRVAVLHRLGYRSEVEFWLGDIRLCFKLSQHSPAAGK